MNRAIFLLLGFAVAVADSRGDEPTGANPRGRVVEGKIVAAGNQPIEGATVLFGQNRDTASHWSRERRPRPMPKAVTGPIWSISRGPPGRSRPSSWHPATRPPTERFGPAREQRRPTSRLVAEPLARDPGPVGRQLGQASRR